MESLPDDLLNEFQATKKSLAKSFNGYKRYYDKEAGANHLTERRKCFLLKPDSLNSQLSARNRSNNDSLYLEWTEY